MCDLTCTPITEMCFAFRKAETVDLFSPERDFFRRVMWPCLPYFPSYRIDIQLCLGHRNNACLMLIGGGSACACTGVGVLLGVCTMSIEEHAWACTVNTINLVLL